MAKRRKQFREARKSCVKLQASVRGFAARKRALKLRRERDALVVIMLWARAWVFRRRRHKLEEAEKKMKRELLVRRTCAGHDASSRDLTRALTIESVVQRELGSHWHKLKNHSAALLGKLRAVQEAEAEGGAKGSSAAAVAVKAEFWEAATEKAAKAEARAAAIKIEQMQAKIEALEKANKELRAASASSGPSNPLLATPPTPKNRSPEPSPPRFKDRKRPPALSIG